MNHAERAASPAWDSAAPGWMWRLPGAGAVRGRD